MTFLDYCPTGFLISPSDTIGAMLWQNMNRKINQAVLLDGEGFFTNISSMTPSLMVSRTLSVKMEQAKKGRRVTPRVCVCVIVVAMVFNLCCSS